MKNRRSTEQKQKGGFEVAVSDVECCDFYQVHDDVVKAVKEKMPDEDELYDLAEIFKVFGDSTRIKILYVLFEQEMCVCDIAQLLNMTQSAISHQLKILKQSRLVKNRREGKAVFYSLADGHVRSIINQGLEHIEE
jgi:ArsR family transcriptional regulator, lead/cadmium/zinc/bismuth-responsive transcriptional repressor